MKCGSELEIGRSNVTFYTCTRFDHGKMGEGGKIGFLLSLSMFDLLKTGYRGDVFAKDLHKHTGNVVKMVSLYVCEKTVYTKNSKKMWFGIFLDVHGDSFDTIHFRNSTNVPIQRAWVLPDLG